MARPAADRAKEYPEHPARALLKQYGVGNKQLDRDRQAVNAAYGKNTAITVLSPDGRKQQVVYAHPGTTLEQVAFGVAKRGRGEDAPPPSPTEAAAQLKELRDASGGLDDAQLLARLQQQQKISSQAYFHELEAIERFLTRSKADEKFRAEMAPYMGFSPAPNPAPVGRPVGDAASQAAAAPPAAGPPPVESPAADVPAASPGAALNAEVDNWWTGSQPELKDIPVLGGMPRWGLAALGAGTTAATAGLAYHLMAKGQQQSDPVAYAAAVQAMNAY